MLSRKANRAFALLCCLGFGYGCLRAGPEALRPARATASSSSSAVASSSLQASLVFGCPAAAASAARGTRPDGRVDASACDAWPRRHAEPEPLSRQETAKACAVLGACGKELLALAAADDDRIAKDAGIATAACSRMAMWFEERAIPFGPFSERWSYVARAILKESDPCKTLSAQLLKRPEGLECQEVGCSEEEPAKTATAFSCEGSKAQRNKKGETESRDCARAYAGCDASSRSGCTDRGIVGCDAAALDRCDGAIKLGCDGEGRLSFHDCSRIPNGICVENEKGAKCVSGDSGACDSTKEVCDGSRLTLCIQGQPTQVDCAALGVGSCVVEAGRAHCAKK